MYSSVFLFNIGVKLILQEIIIKKISMASATVVSFILKNFKICTIKKLSYEEIQESFLPISLNLLRWQP